MIQVGLIMLYVLEEMSYLTLSLVSVAKDGYVAAKLFENLELGIIAVMALVVIT